MIFNIYSIRDRAIDSYGRPFYMQTHAAATRAFKDELNREGSEMSPHPEDYDLFHLGSFNDATGEFITQQPQQIAIGKDLKPMAFTMTTTR